MGVRRRVAQPLDQALGVLQLLLELLQLSAQAWRRSCTSSVSSCHRSVMRSLATSNQRPLSWASSAAPGRAVHSVRRRRSS
jgi:hypothetical protein